MENTLEQEFLNALESLSIDDFMDEYGNIDVEYFSLKCEEVL